MNRAVFLDRDGTIIEDSGFLRDPDQVRLLPGAATAIARLRKAGWRIVVVTNQSGIARGLITEAEYQVVAQTVEDLLTRQGTAIDASFHCPHHPEVTGACECRKPGTLHYRTAAAQFGVDLVASVWIGDRMTDLLPGRTLGGRSILVTTGVGASVAGQAKADGFDVVEDLAAAASMILDQPRD